MPFVYLNMSVKLVRPSSTRKAPNEKQAAHMKKKSDCVTPYMSPSLNVPFTFTLKKVGRLGSVRVLHVARAASRRTSGPA